MDFEVAPHKHGRLIERSISSPRESTAMHAIKKAEPMLTQSIRMLALMYQCRPSSVKGKSRELSATKGRGTDRALLMRTSSDRLTKALCVESNGGAIYVGREDLTGAFARSQYCCVQQGFQAPGIKVCFSSVRETSEAGRKLILPNFRVNCKVGTPVVPRSLGGWLRRGY
jgi:hypothetical protein